MWEIRMGDKERARVPGAWQKIKMQSENEETGKVTEK